MTRFEFEHRDGPDPTGAYRRACWTIGLFWCGICWAGVFLALCKWRGWL